MGRGLGEDELARGKARIQGQLHYLGRPCVNCGGILRYVATKVCVNCHRTRHSLDPPKKKTKNPEVYEHPLSIRPELNRAYLIDCYREKFHLWKRRAITKS